MGRHRFEPKVDRRFDAKPGTIERVEVITGVGRRRRWPADVKAQIITESLEKGAIVSEVARRHGLRPQQLFGWRKQAGNHVAVASFAPVVVDAAVPGSPFRTAVSNGRYLPRLRSFVGAALIRVRGVVDVKTLTAVLRAVKATSLGNSPYAISLNHAGQFRLVRLGWAPHIRGNRTPADTVQAHSQANKARTIDLREIFRRRCHPGCVRPTR
jgi:transposase